MSKGVWTLWVVQRASPHLSAMFIRRGAVWGHQLGERHTYFLLSLGFSNRPAIAARQ